MKSDDKNFLHIIFRERLLTIIRNKLILKLVKLVLSKIGKTD